MKGKRKEMDGFVEVFFEVFLFAALKGWMKRVSALKDRSIKINQIQFKGHSIMSH